MLGKKYLKIDLCQEKNIKNGPKIKKDQYFFVKIEKK